MSLRMVKSSATLLCPTRAPTVWCHPLCPVAQGVVLESPLDRLDNSIVIAAPELTRNDQAPVAFLRGERSLAASRREPPVA